MPITAKTTTGLNLRSSPGGTILKTVASGTDVQVTGISAEWVPVRVGDTSGYMSRAHLRVVSGSVKASVTAQALNLRASASGSAAVRATLARGTELVATGWDGDWLAVTCASGAGFVSIAYVGTAAAPAPAPASGRLADSAAVRARRQQIAEMQDANARGDAFEQLHHQSPYFTQRDNEAKESGVQIETEGGRMCNLTSLAMGLSYLGIDNPRPPAQFEDVLEAMRQENGLPDRTEAKGWGGVAQLFGVECRFVLSGPAVKARSWWESTVRPRLRAGNAVILSISGHIVRMVGVTGDGLVIDDPYGHSRMLPGEERSWYAKNGWRDRTAVVGRGIVYPWSEVEAHTFRWVAALSEADALSFSGAGDLPELPDLRDDEPSDDAREDAPTAG